MLVSIHAPNEGSDVPPPCKISNVKFQSTLPMKGATVSRPTLRAASWFQSTLPMKGATSPFSNRRTVMLVSIHAPNEGSDPVDSIT